MADYPCKHDTPQTCGWSRRDREDTTSANWICIYPNCYYGKQEVATLVGDRRGKESIFFSTIDVGTSSIMAETLYDIFSEYKKSRTIIILPDTKKSYTVISVTITCDNGYYKLDVIGEFV